MSVHAEGVPLVAASMLAEEREQTRVAQVRVGYLEECLRRIADIATSRTRSRDSRSALVQVGGIALRALREGDPDTCPEARK